METKFNSQICTSIEQSKALLTLGLKKETADMTWFRRSKNADWESSTISYEEWVKEILPIVDGYTLEDIIPAWSLHKLILLLDTIACDWIFRNGDCYTNAINGIEWLIKEGYFNKEYLV